MEPSIISGNCHTDSRGTLLFNNNFDASSIKRVYVIENNGTNFIRAWQGHRLEQRWFSAIHGSFKVRLIAIDNWDAPDQDLIPKDYILSSDKMDVLHVPKGYVSSIQALTDGARLLVMADFMMGEIKDEYRFQPDYFRNALN